MPLNDPVPSTATDVLNRNVQDIDRIVNETANVTTRTGRVMESFPMSTERATQEADRAEAAQASTTAAKYAAEASAATAATQAGIATTKANEAAGSVLNAQQAAQTALATGNYEGRWSTLSGAYNAGISVEHNNIFWALRSNTSNIASIQPGVSAGWIAINGANLGTAATRDVGTAAGNIPTNSHLDSAPAILDARRRAVEDASGGRNTVIYDAQGNPNVMVVVPRFNYEDLNLPGMNLGTGTPTAFLTNGVPRGEILIGKYQASTAAGGTAVVGGVQPRVYVNYDTAKSLCTQKGAGWHLMSAHEWPAIALFSLANGTVPRGNTNYGRSYIKQLETALRADAGMPGDAGGTALAATGTGPATWTHDHTQFGIHDLVGNAWEWLDQLKMIDGQLITTNDNNPAVLEGSWINRAAFYDNNVLNSKLDSMNPSTGVNFEIMTKSGTYVTNELMRRLLLEPTGTTLDGKLYANSEGERMPLRGGSWSSGSFAGLAALSFYNSRTVAGNYIGFRPAFFL